MKISELMRPGAFTISETDCLGDARLAMARANIHHLPVVTDGRLVGMLSERDVRTAIGDPIQFLEARSRSDAQYHVQDVMTRPAETVPFDQPLLEVARRFADERIGALPVVDRFGAVIGIVSYVDALRVLAA